MLRHLSPISIWCEVHHTPRIHIISRSQCRPFVPAWQESGPDRDGTAPSRPGPLRGIAMRHVDAIVENRRFPAIAQPVRHKMTIAPDYPPGFSRSIFHLLVHQPRALSRPDRRSRRTRRHPPPRLNPTSAGTSAVSRIRLLSGSTPTADGSLIDIPTRH